MFNNTRGSLMSVLLVAAALTATASVVATGCVAYVLISFASSEQLLASRIGRQSLSAVMVTPENARLRAVQKARATRAHKQPRPLFAN
jgi:hypothetical protein